MAEERAVVLDVFGAANEFARVKTQRQSTCNACQLKTSCGQHLISKITGGQGVELEVENSLAAKPGDIVILSIPDSGLLKASLLMFMLPLLTMFCFALAAKWFLFLSDPLVALVSLTGLVGGFILVRKLSSRFEQDAAFKPVMSAFAMRASSIAICAV